MYGTQYLPGCFNSTQSPYYHSPASIGKPTSELPLWVFSNSTSAYFYNVKESIQIESSYISRNYSCNVKSPFYQHSIDSSRMSYTDITTGKIGNIGRKILNKDAIEFWLTGVIWMVQVDSTDGHIWIEYEIDLAQIMEDAKNKGQPKCYVNIMGKDYEMDLINCRQENRSTRYCREIKREVDTLLNIPVWAYSDSTGT